MKLVSDLKISVPGTCGEWIQGYMKGEAVLISCPIELYSTASVETSINHERHMVKPEACQKALKAAELALKHTDSHMGFDMLIESQLPVARGYGSSTADITCAAAVMFQTQGINPGAIKLAEIACKIEPSDSTMFPQWYLFSYRSGRWFQSIGDFIRFPLIILDQGEDIDTIQYNQVLNMKALRSLEKTTIQAVDLFIDGVKRKDANRLGAAASLSAKSYQKIIHSDLVEKAIVWAEQICARGLIRAHSGSIVGFLFQRDDELPVAMEWLKKRFSGKIINTHTTGGGIRYLP